MTQTLSPSCRASRRYALDNWGCAGPESPLPLYLLSTSRSPLSRTSTATAGRARGGGWWSYNKARGPPRMTYQPQSTAITRDLGCSSCPLLAFLDIPIVCVPHSLIQNGVSFSPSRRLCASSISEYPESRISWSTPRGKPRSRYSPNNTCGNMMAGKHKGYSCGEWTRSDKTSRSSGSPG